MNMKIKNKFLPIKKILFNMRKDHIGASSAQCAYYVILSFVPFIILLLTLIQYTNIQPQQLFDIISAIIPSYMSEMVLGVVSEVYSKSIGTISLSLIFILLSADRGLFALTKELHTVYNFHDSKRKSFLRLKLMSLLKTVIFIVIIVIGLVILVFGRPILSTIQEDFGIFRNYTIITDIIVSMLIIFVTFTVFLCIYKFIPEHKITFKSQIKGAVFGSLMLNIVSFIFSKYLDIFKSFSITYGSLTALMLVMMWTYACFYIIFVGAEINKYYNKNTRKNNTPKTN